MSPQRSEDATSRGGAIRERRVRFGAVDRFGIAVDLHAVRHPLELNNAMSLHLDW